MYASLSACGCCCCLEESAAVASFCGWLTDTGGALSLVADAASVVCFDASGFSFPVESWDCASTCFSTQLPSGLSITFAVVVAIEGWLLSDGACTGRLDAGDLTSLLSGDLTPVPSDETEDFLIFLSNGDLIPLPSLGISSP